MFMLSKYGSGGALGTGSMYPSWKSPAAGGELSPNSPAVVCCTTADAESKGALLLLLMVSLVGELGEEDEGLVKGRGTLPSSLSNPDALFSSSSRY